MKNKRRKITGAILTVLSVLLTGQISFVMVRKIHKVNNPKIYKKNLFADQMLCFTLILSALDIMTGFLGKGKNLILKIIGWITRITVFLSSAIVLFFGGKILIGSLIKHKKHAEYAIVLGMALEDSRPAKDLLYRMETALRFLRENPEGKLILAGGSPDKNGMTEAEVMRRYLLNKGVDKDRLLLEDKSDSTKQNIHNSMEFVSPDSPIILITSNYHMNRAVKIAKKAGFHTVYRLPARSEFLPFASNVFWEILHNINEYTGIVKDY